MTTRYESASRTRRYATFALALTSIAALSACGGAAAGGGGGTDASAAPTTELVFASWGGAYEEATQTSLVAPWEEESGVSVTMVAAPGTQVAGLEAQRSAGKHEWDVLDVASPDAIYAEEQGLVAKLPDDVKSELEEVLLPGAVSDYGFRSTSLGKIIVCNMEMVEVCPQNMEEFFDVENFPGTRTIPNQALEGLSLAAIAAGTPASSLETEPIDIDAALEQLKAVRDSVTVFWDSGDQMEQVMQNGEAAIGILYSGRTVGLIDSGLDLEPVWTDGLYDSGYFVVAEDSVDKEAAFDLLISMANNVDGLAAWAEALNYSVPNQAALDLIPADKQDNLADNHVDEMATLNLDWYAENKAAVDDAWLEYVSG